MGELPGGARIAELTLVEKLGVSRTPIRAALMRLEQEGLLHRLPGGGYAVRTFSETDVADAIELRGTMEGLAARLAAERGVAPAPPAAQKPGAGQPRGSATPPPPARTDRLIIVALDPGHGGEDPGAIGPGGTHEKQVVLQIALKLDQLLAQPATAIERAVRPGVKQPDPEPVSASAAPERRSITWDT